MPDSHFVPSEKWGLHPVLFQLWGFQCSSYTFFVFLGIVAGFITFYYLANKSKSLNSTSINILMAGFTGGVIGAKLPMLIFNISLLLHNRIGVNALFDGKTITGGLIGGTLAIILIKKKLGIKDKKGNIFAPAIAVGAAIGRIGCLMAGCCYGKPTKLPWGINFGDAIPRHPTQIYEIVFFVISAIILLKYWDRARPGYLFFLFINAYFIFRFFEEFIREEPVLIFNFTIFQAIAVASLIFINAMYIMEIRNGKIT
jgi:prolipoprotein diacylglyceryl transferase